MKLQKLEKFLLLIANSIYSVYIIFLLFWVNNFKEYVEVDHLRSKMVDQIREQTKMTMDSANVSTKDINYIFSVMGQLAYLYLALFVILLLILIWLQIKGKNVYIFGYVLLIYSIAILIFTLGILFISCIIYFFVGLKLMIKGRNYSLQT